MRGRKGDSCIMLQELQDLYPVFHNVLCVMSVSSIFMYTMFLSCETPVTETCQNVSALKKKYYLTRNGLHSVKINLEHASLQCTDIWSRVPKKTKHIKSCSLVADNVSCHDNKHIFLGWPFMLRSLTGCYGCYRSVSSFFWIWIKQWSEIGLPIFNKPCS